MKVQQFARGFVDDHEKSTTWLSLGCCKRLRPLAPKIDLVSSSTAASTMFDLKSFIKPECGSRNVAPAPPNSNVKKDSFQAGGTRWNPTEEQIGILEALYATGIRTPNTHQIDHITSQLSQYGKIEGKNVFYWFQNHKARERQRRRNRTSNTSPTTANTTPCNMTSITLSFDSTKEEYGWKREEQAATPLSKRKCTSWTFESTENESSNYLNNSTENDEEDHYGVNKITLHLFPLHPETR